MEWKIRMINEFNELKMKLERIEKALNANTDRIVGISKASEISGITKSALRQRAARGIVSCTKDETGGIKPHSKA